LIAEDGTHNLDESDIDKFDAIKSVLNPHGPDIPTRPCVSWREPLVLSLHATRDTFFRFCKDREKHTSPFVSRFPISNFAVFALYRRSSKTPITTTCTEYADALTATCENWRKETIPGHSPPLALPPCANLDISIENMGHINFGRRMGTDLKGVRIEDSIQSEWFSCFFSEEDLDEMMKQDVANTSLALPAIFTTTFIVEFVGDTYLQVDSHKGSAFVNGHGLGRYWDVGPQKKLYVPGPFLRKGANVLTILEFSGGDQDSRTARLTCPKSREIIA